VRPEGSAPGWVLDEIPFALDSLTNLYGPNFDPHNFTRISPLIANDTPYYFEAHGANASSLALPGGIRKVYPEATNPGTDSARWTPDDLTLEHGIPLPKYYEYEYVHENLLPTVPYYVSVTSMDFGSPASGLPALESSPVNSAIQEYPLTPSDTVAAKHLDVYVYPNPYRIDANYAGQGYENRLGNLPPDRARRIHFANLPAVCKISIFSLDGDLIRSWEHDYSPTDPQAMHDAWDLITRNTMLVVSGLYYWVVESEGRTQIGKFVIIE
jgi:hypothetical protein